MDIRDYIEKKKQIVEDRLDSVLPREDEFPASIHKAMRYSIMAGGKRIRPVLVFAATDALNGDIKGAEGVAAAIELIHTYSLIHDDLPAMDDDDLRRGKPTCHKVFGEAVAILAGDALLTLAFEVAVDSLGGVPDSRIECVRELSRAAGSAGMVGGQVIDLESEGLEIPLPILETIHIRKTGAMIRAAVRCGAIISGCSDDELSCLSRYGEAAGLAFQIIDDILDVEGDSSVVGKNVRGDAKKGKATYPSLIGLRDSREMAAGLLERALSSLDDFDIKADPLRGIARYIIDRRY